MSRNGSERQDRGERLDSWKEIAVYLRRSVRTVRRWEKLEGLPVRRHRHSRGGSTVFAHKSEIDAWSKKRDIEREQEHGQRRPRTFLGVPRRWAMLSGALLAALVMTTGALYITHLRGRLAPPEREQAERRLEGVTTSSRRAVLLYTQAGDSLRRDDPAAAIELLREAVAEDPRFASAYIRLARALHDQGEASDEALDHARRALELAEDVSVQERYYIQAGYRELSGEREKAIALYSALLSLNPAHYWGNRGLARLYRELGREQESVAYQVKLAELQPADFGESYRAARVLTLWDSVARAEPYARRARDLVSLETSHTDPQAVAWTEMFHAHRSWLEGDPARAMFEAAAVGATLDDRPPHLSDALAGQVGDVHLAAGRLDEAERWFRRISDPVDRHEQLSLVKLAGKDMPGLRQHLLSGKSYRDPFTAMLLSHLGLPEEAGRLLADLETRGASPVRIEIARGRVDLASGREARGIRRLQETVGELRSSGDHVFFAGADALAMALKQRGDLPAALEALEMTSPQRTVAAFAGRGMFWIICQFNLAKLYREAGREADAQAIEDELRGLLEHADPDHPILLALS